MQKMLVRPFVIQHNFDISMLTCIKLYSDEMTCVLLFNCDIQYITSDMTVHAYQNIARRLIQWSCHKILASVLPQKLLKHIQPHIVVSLCMSDVSKWCDLRSDLLSVDFC